MKSLGVINMSNLELKQNATLGDYQKYVVQMIEERGLEKGNALELFLRLNEEIGELAKAMRKQEGMKTAGDSHKPELEHEIADVFIFLLDICNHYDIDLEKAFRDKEEINKQRVWK